MFRIVLVALAGAALLTLSVIPDLHADEDRLELHEGAQEVVWELEETTAAASLGNVTVACQRPADADWLCYIPQYRRTNFPIRPGDVLWIVAPMDLTIHGSPRVLAFCNNFLDRPRDLYLELWEACHALGTAEGVDFDVTWHSYVEGVQDWNDLQYRIDGGSPFNHADHREHRNRFDALAPGPHVIETRKALSDGQWGAWGEPYAFTVRVVLWVGVCDQPWPGYRDCAAQGQTDGIRHGVWPFVVENALDADRAWYWIDAAAVRGVEAARERIRQLPRGQHTIYMGEYRTWGWTGWSAPYRFTIR